MNKREAIKCMLDGKKVRKIDWSIRKYICFDDTYDLRDEYGMVSSFLNGLGQQDWEIYEEPKPKKKITFTRPKWAKFYERLNTCPEWMSTKEAWLNLHSNPITSDEWETMEIEVEE